MKMESKHSTKGLSRRAFLRVMGAGSAGAMLLAACPAPAPAPQSGGSADAPAPAQEAVTISQMAFGQPDVPPYEGVAAEYMSRSGNVTVETVFLPSDETYYATLQTQFAGGSNPDLASMQGWGYQIFADNQTLAGVQALRERDDFNYAWADSEAIRQYTERSDDTYLIPMQLATMLMFYAKQPFDEAGIPYPTNDWTFAEFLEIAEQLTIRDGDRRQWGFQSSGQWFRDIHWIRGTGAQEFDSLVDPRTSQFNQQPIIDIVQLVASDFYHTMGISPTPADLDSGSGGIEAGQSAMKYEGAWWFPQMVTPQLREQDAAIEFDVVLMPQQEDGERPHRGWAEGLVIFNTAPLEAAWDYVKFASGEEGQKIFSTISGRIPNNFDLVDSHWAPTVQENHGLTNTAAFIEAFSKGEADVISGLPRSQYWLEVIKPVGWDPLMAGSASAADVLPLVDEGVQKLLDDYWASRG